MRNMFREQCEPHESSVQEQHDIKTAIRYKREHRNGAAF